MIALPIRPVWRWRHSLSYKQIDALDAESGEAEAARQTPSAYHLPTSLVFLEWGGAETALAIGFGSYSQPLPGGWKGNQDTPNSNFGHACVKVDEVESQPMEWMGCTSSMNLHSLWCLEMWDSASQSVYDIPLYKLKFYTLLQYSLYYTVAISQILSPHYFSSKGIFGGTTQQSHVPINSITFLRSHTADPVTTMPLCFT